MVGPGQVIQIIQGVWQLFAGGDIRLKSDYVSTSRHSCDPAVCPWQPKSEPVLTIEQRVFLLGLVRSRLELLARFEYNGCDVNNVRITIGRRSFIGFASGASFEAVATGGASNIPGASGCPDCCPTSTCVEFDLVVYADAVLTVGGGTMPYTVRICGDGQVVTT